MRRYYFWWELKERVKIALLYLFLAMCALGWVILWVGIPGLVFFALLKYVTGWQL